MKVNSIDKTNYNITFQMKPGKNIIGKATKACDNNKEIVDRFVKSFREKHSKSIDKHTVIDLNNDMSYVCTNTKFPGIEYVSDIQLSVKENRDILHSLLSESSSIIQSVEYHFFRKIITDGLKQGKSINSLRKEAHKIKLESRRKIFLRELDLAQFILKDNPKSNLSDMDFLNAWLCNVKMPRG